ncbi:MAG TPA: JAB domain-containing protein [Candidatus Saccharimonadales bacterium]|nr:JAB domain-containing protein [Candidatus Saccharimonadales bacterium]
MNDRQQQKTSVDILAQLAFIRQRKQEYLVCLSMSKADQVIRRRVISIGLLDMVPTHPRELFAGAITDRAAYIIVGHNHPSGEVRPSSDDITATQQLVAAGILLGIPVKDHIIVTGNSHYSFRARMLI